MKKIKVFLATDHAGLAYKESIKEYLLFKDIEVIDFGANIYNEKDDYPDFIHEAGKALSDVSGDIQSDVLIGDRSFGIVFGGSGTGEAIVMNRYCNARCVVSNSDNAEIVSLSRKHNNANAISFGARFLSLDKIKAMIDILLNTNFEMERHSIRIQK